MVIYLRKTAKYIVLRKETIGSQIMNKRLAARFTLSTCEKLAASVCSYLRSV